MVKSREDRSYGGKAGIWLKKRRKQAVHPQQTKVTPPSTTSSIKKNHSDEASTAQNPSKQVIIGWDDKRCRPIYRESAASSSGTCSTTASTSTINNSDDETEARDDDGSRKEDCSDEEDVDTGEPTSSVLVTNTNKTETLRKNRAYGSRKRVSNLSSCHDIMEVQQRKRQHVTNKKKTTLDAASMMTPSTNSRMTFDLETPQTLGLGDNICDALNSDTKATPRDFGASNDSTVAFKTTRPAKKEKKSASLAMKPKNTKQRKLPALAQLDFIDEQVSQPSSTTSLAAARAFFERLDAQQTLILDTSDTPVGKKKCIRTRRAISVEGNDGLQKEYQDYVAATRATGVEPLSLEQYAVNRSAFFRGDMYEGFLNG